MKLTEANKFEAIKYRHEDQAKYLQYLISMDFKVFSSYLTLQMLFGGFLIQQSITDCYFKLGLLLVDLPFPILTYFFIKNNCLRRLEVIKTIKNCNEFLGFEREGAYLKDKVINAKNDIKPWDFLYRMGVITAFIGVVLILFGA